MGRECHNCVDNAIGFIKAIKNAERLAERETKRDMYESNLFLKEAQNRLNELTELSCCSQKTITLAKDILSHAIAEEQPLSRAGDLFGLAALIHSSLVTDIANFCQKRKD